MIAELPEKKVSRRLVLKSTAAAAAVLAIPFEIPQIARAADEKKKPVSPFLSWVRIDSNGKVTLLSSRSEMGQGISTAGPMLIAEELGVDMKDVDVQQAATDGRLFGDQGTGGSGSVAGSWEPLRRAGAAARTMLIAAAAQKWNVDPSACAARDGAVWHGTTSLKYGDLVAAAALLPIPDLEKVVLKKPSEYKVIGTPVPRKDIPSKTDGTAQFGIDVRVPGMKYAMVERCPAFAGKVKRFDASKAKAIPGVVDVFEIPAVPEGVHSWGGVVVVADSTYTAMKARKVLQIDWDFGPYATETSETLRKQFRRLVDTPQKVVLSVGATDQIVSDCPPERKLEADYELPFQAHACMEPMNCTMVLRTDGAEVWAPAQGPEWVQGTAAQVFGLKPEQVKVNITSMGGGFGRRYQADFAMESAQIAKKMAGTPVQLIWSREDDMTHDFYRPASYHRISAALDEKGNIAALNHRQASTSINSWFSPKDSPDGSEMGSTLQNPYVSTNYKLEYAPADSSVPRAWWRSVEASAIGFVMESYVDELAHKANIDPLEFRLRHFADGRKVMNPNNKEDRPLDTARMRKVLQMAAENGDWGKPLPEGRGRGIACHYSFNSYAANVVEVTVKDGKLHVDRIVSAVDIGTAVNPEGVRAQVESAVVYGLTAAMKSQITIANGRTVEQNFDRFPCLRMNETPRMEVHIVKSDIAPTGIGEPGLPPVAPALMNAIFMATGKRVRRLPLLPEDLKA